MKRILSILIGFFIFWTIYVLVEYITVYILGLKLILIDLFKENFFQCMIFYVLIMLSIFIINYIYNFFIIKSLNNKMEILKKGGKDNNE